MGYKFVYDYEAPLNGTEENLALANHVDAILITALPRLIWSFSMVKENAASKPRKNNFLLEAHFNLQKEAAE